MYPPVREKAAGNMAACFTVNGKGRFTTVSNEKSAYWEQSVYV